jgi:Domain of unknown function (DUF309)
VKGPDPRREAAPRGEVPSLLAQGAAEFNARRFWHAHEAWEGAWHALRAAGEAEAARYLQGMILAAAALENATRGKEAGFKRQMAEGLHAMRTSRAGRDALGLADPAAWEDALLALYLDACRATDWARWNGAGWAAPEVGLRPR